MCAELKRRVNLATSGTNGRRHLYHAEATALVGDLQLPLVQEIKPQAYAKLPDDGGYLSQRAADYRLEGVISFQSAYTQVAGNPGKKTGHRVSTLSTAVVEGLNVLDVVTADRVAAQVSIDYPVDGFVPHVTFLGTQFENLRIAGHPTKLDLDLDIVGPKPENDLPYTKASGFMDRVARQHGNVRAHPSLLTELIGRYSGFPASRGNADTVECSLVNGAEGSFPGRCFGHVIDVPDFGTIVLAALCLEHSDFEASIPKKTTVRLTMLELKMGCIGHGKVSAASTVTNGGDTPG
jgi:hypothetical protein